MEQKTAIQTLLKYLDSDDFVGVSDIRDAIDELLQIERTQIENAVIYGLDEDGHTGDWKINVARKYYNDTYKNQ